MFGRNRGKQSRDRGLRTQVSGFPHNYKTGRNRPCVAINLNLYTMSAYFKNVIELPPDPLFGLKARFTADKRTDKVDLGIGAYRDENGKPWILPAVRAAEKKLQEDKNYNHEYLAIEGYAPFVREAARVILGPNSVAINDKRVVSQQTLSGTGALHIASKLLRDFYAGPADIYISDPTWANHRQIFNSAGLAVKTYPYWNGETKSLNLDGMLGTIRSAQSGLVFVLHACAHNPTGLDPSKEQWQSILKEIEAKKHMVLFDSAYQGFALGDLDKDAYAIRHAIDDHVLSTPIIVCQSFAKNCGMYGERVGAMHLVLPRGGESEHAAFVSQLCKMIRLEISNPPAYGAKIVAAILTDPQLYSQWRQDLVTMSLRIGKMRRTLRDLLQNELHTPGTWDHITSQQGMFSFTGLTSSQVQRLEEKHGVYMVLSGRASVAGLNDHNVGRVAHAIDEVVRQLLSHL